jgi:glutaminyl-tRNA synthetase
MSKSAKDKADPALDPVVPLLKSIGLSEAKAVEAAKSPKIAAELKDIIEAYGLNTRAERLDDKQAGLIVALAGQLVKADTIAEEKRAYVVRKITDAQLKSVDQVAGGSSKHSRLRELTRMIFVSRSEVR